MTKPKIAPPIKLPREQPRAISSTDSQIVQPYFRAGMQVELQKFGLPKSKQPLLGEDTDSLAESKSYGLDLSVTEARALHAIQKLLADTGYQGNKRGKEIQSAAYQWAGYLPTLSITYTDYYKAYGLEPAGDGRYHGAQAMDSLKALKSLINPRVMTYSRRKGFKDGKPISDAKRVIMPLIQIIAEGFQDLDEDELAQVEAGQELPGQRLTRLTIVPSPIMMMEIDSFYLLKPVGLYSEVRALLPGQRISKATTLFIEWLLTLDMPVIKISRRALAEKLRLDSLVEQRKQALLDKRIQEALEVAKELGYLLDYEEQPTSLLVLRLNPERCRRIGMKRSKPRKEKG